MSESAKKTILLVEDETILAMSTKKQLEQYGYAIKTVNNGEKAIEAVKTSTDIDLILMDINLGSGIDGTQAAEIILRDHDIPVIFVSSHSEREVVEKTEKITSYGYVVKNSSITVLDASIKMAFKLFDEKERFKAVNDKLEATFDALPDLLFEVGLDGYYYNSHSSKIELLYKPLLDVIGKYIPDILPVEVSDIIMSAIIEANEKGFSQGKQYELEVPAGIRWFEISVSPIASFPDRPHFILLCRDITKRKKDEKALIESKQEAEMLLNISAEIIISHDLQGVITLLNESGHRILGYKSPELFGKNWFDTCLPVEDKVEIRKYFGLLFESGSDSTVTHENDVITKSGERKTIFWHNSILKDNESRVIGLLSSGKDITDRKKIEADLESQRLLYEEILEQTLAGYWDWDILSGDEYLSPAFKKMFGYEENEIENRADSWQKLIFTDDLPSVYEMFNLHSESNGEIPFYNEVRYHHKNGSTVWVICTGKIIEWDDDGKAKRMIGCHIDITERKKIEEALKENEERFKFALEGSNLGEWDWNLKTNELIRNARWAEMLGYTSDEINGNLQQGFDLQHPDDRERTWQAIQDHIDGKTDYYSVEYRMKMKNSSYKWIQECGKVMELDIDGKPLRICGTHADVDEKRKSRNMIDALLAEKELILKEVHHRIKNNMNTVSSLLSLQASAITEPVAIMALTDAGNRIQSMSLLYDKLYRSPDFTELSIKDYLTSLIDEVIANFPNSQMVKVEKDIQDFVLDVKRLQPLGIIINELLTNIMKYAFIGKENGLITVSVKENDGHVRIIVQDDGNGIPESVPFKNSTGFGLQLVYALAQQLNGLIRMERDAGTKIILEF